MSQLNLGPDMAATARNSDVASWLMYNIKANENKVLQLASVYDCYQTYCLQNNKVATPVQNFETVLRKLYGSVITSHAGIGLMVAVELVKKEKVLQPGQVIIPQDCDVTTGTLDATQESFLNIRVPTEHIVDDKVLAVDVRLIERVKLSMYVDGVKLDLGNLGISESFVLNQNNVNGILNCLKKMTFCNGMEWDDGFVGKPVAKQMWSSTRVRGAVSCRVKGWTCNIVESFWHEGTTCTKCKAALELFREKRERKDAPIEDMEVEGDDTSAVVQETTQQSTSLSPPAVDMSDAVSATPESACVETEPMSMEPAVTEAPPARPTITVNLTNAMPACTTDARPDVTEPSAMPATPVAASDITDAMPTSTVTIDDAEPPSSDTIPEVTTPVSGATAHAVPASNTDVMPDVTDDVPDITLPDVADVKTEDPDVTEPSVTDVKSDVSDDVPDDSDVTLPADADVNPEVSDVTVPAVTNVSKGSTSMKTVPDISDDGPAITDMVCDITVPAVSDVIAPTISDAVPDVTDVKSDVTVPAVSDAMPDVTVSTTPDTLPDATDVMSDVTVSAVSSPVPNDVKPAISDALPKIPDAVPAVTDAIPTVSDALPASTNAMPVITNITTLAETSSKKKDQPTADALWNAKDQRNLAAILCWLATSYRKSDIRDDSTVCFITKYECIFSKYTIFKGSAPQDWEKTCILNCIGYLFPGADANCPVDQAAFLEELKPAETNEGPTVVKMPAMCWSWYDGHDLVIKVKTVYIIDGDLLYYYIFWSKDNISVKFRGKTHVLYYKKNHELQILQETFDGVLNLCQKLWMCCGFETLDADLENPRVFVECWASLADPDDMKCRTRSRVCEMMRFERRDQQMCKPCQAVFAPDGKKRPARPRDTRGEMEREFGEIHPLFPPKEAMLA